MRFTIRRIKIDDGRFVQDVARRSWEYTYKNIFSDDFIKEFITKAYDPQYTSMYLKQIDGMKGEFIVAEVEGSIIGFAQIGPDLDFIGEYRLSRIYLLPKFLGQGIGKQLLERCEVFLKTIEVSKYGLYVHKDNEIGKKFYWKCGFTNLPERDDDDEIYLFKEL